jgi:hypothetical protein
MTKAEMSEIPARNLSISIETRTAEIVVRLDSSKAPIRNPVPRWLVNESAEG